MISTVYRDGREIEIEGTDALINLAISDGCLTANLFDDCMRDSRFTVEETPDVLLAIQTWIESLTPTEGDTT